MEQSTSEEIPCLSAAEHESSRVTQNNSDLLRPDEDELGSSTPPPGQDEQQALRDSVSRRTSLETVIESTTVTHPSDSSKSIPRALSFSWSSLVADVFSILVTIPFIVLACLLAQVKGKVVEKNALLDFENGIRVVSIPTRPTSYASPGYH